MAENQKDLVLNPNTYSYVLDETKGHVSCLVGPMKMSLSQSDRLVDFDKRTKSFVSVYFEDAPKQITVIPENWYCVLKNPICENRHPKPGTANMLPEDMLVGRKINIRGPESFALWPGQMAQVIKGHTLRSNQYLLARVYEAESANASQGGEMLDAEGNKIQTNANYTNGQILVIKGTEVSFYIPPTGIEVIAINNNPSSGYVRDAVTLERLEYCILKNENGNKRYVHGPAVVFPEPTESFISSPKNGYVFRAIELSKISGIYVKVIAEYDEEFDGNIIHHPVGEELFITGNEQMIYYPRPEHAVITYDNKIMHHAIAIPAGEGRYVMNRLTGEIKTIRGPVMYLPDPRYEVVVKRKLTPSQCELWFPGNKEALAYNAALSEKSVEKSSKTMSMDDFAYITASSTASTLAYLETNGSISRGTSYTKPRTITLDTKYDGVVSVDVWTGYAVNVVSKSGERHVVCGPQTILLDYDQSFEVLTMSTGKPKTTDFLEKTVFLRHENNKVSDIINIETKDFVRADVKVSYCVNFKSEDVNKWFNVENYVKYLCDRERTLMKRAAKNYTIEEFYQNYSDIIHDVAVDKEGEQGYRYFPENGMCVTDCEVLSISVQKDIASLLEEHQYEMVQKALELTDAERSVALAEALAEAEFRKQELKTQTTLDRIDLEAQEKNAKLQAAANLARKEEAEKMAQRQAEKDMQPLLDEIQQAKLSRMKAEMDQQNEQAMFDEEIKRQALDKYAETIASIMSSISPDLVAAMTSSANKEMVNTVAKSMAPLAIARGESVTEVVNGLLRGTTLEDVVKRLPKAPESD